MLRTGLVLGAFPESKALPWYPWLNIRPDSRSLWTTKHFLSFMGFVDSIHHSSHSAVLSSKPSATSAPQGVKAEPSSNPISLPAPQNPPQEASQAHPGMRQPTWQELCLLSLSCLFDSLSGTSVSTVRGWYASNPRRNQGTILVC